MDSKLRFSSLVLIVCVLAGLLGGCINRSNYNIAKSVEFPARAHIASGQWLKDSSEFSAIAMVTHYDENGLPRLNKLEVEIDVNSASISASCQLPETSWWARTTLGSSFNPLAASVMFSDYIPMFWGKTRSEVIDTLKIILHRVRGPINFCDKESAIAKKNVFAAGYSTFRISATGSDMASAYFFSTEDGKLKMLTTGGMAATEEGTVTIYTLGYDAKGAVVPTAFEIVEIGDNSIIGMKKILSVSFENILTD